MSQNPDPIDIHVGQRLRLLRKAAGQTQVSVASELGLSFQQVQKYEKGTSRIGAGRLYRLATLLGIPISYFYDDLPPELLTREASCSNISTSDNAGDVMAALYDERNALQLVRAYLNIPDERVRIALMDTAQSMARSFSRKSCS